MEIDLITHIFIFTCVHIMFELCCSQSHKKIMRNKILGMAGSPGDHGWHFWGHQGKGGQQDASGALYWILSPLMRNQVQKRTPSPSLRRRHLNWVSSECQMCQYFTMWCGIKWETSQIWGYLHNPVCYEVRGSDGGRKAGHASSDGQAYPRADGGHVAIWMHGSPSGLFTPYGSSNQSQASLGWRRCQSEV